MKKSILILLFCYLFCQSKAQSFVFSVSTKNCKDSILVLNFLYADRHYKHPTVKIPINQKGKGRQVISILHPMFALLKFNGFEQRLLISPGRNINVNIDGSKKDSIISFSETASPENNWIRNSKHGEIPFYSNYASDKNPYAKMNRDSLEQFLIKKLEAEIETRLQEISLLHIPPRIKKMLLLDLKYMHQLYLYNLSTNDMRWAKNPQRDQLMERVMQWLPIPDSTTLENSFFANMMFGYHQAEAIRNLTKNIPRTGSNKLVVEKLYSEYFKLPFDEINTLVKKYGERYILSWLDARNRFSKHIQGKIIFSKLIEAYEEGSYETARFLFDTLVANYPTSRYIQIARLEIEEMNSKLKAQEHNKAIHIYSNNKPTSLQELLKPYHGKIVYLDIWGTWCGPCKEEMTYIPELKKQFKGKDIVFVYLDMDDDNKENNWKEYVRFNSIEGEHYRLNSNQIQNIWKEIKTKEFDIQSYPTYLIIGRDGKIISHNAERPSSKEILYKQLNEVL